MQASPKKILIIAPAWVGDMIMAQPLLKALKQQNPEVIIDVLAPASTVVLAQRMQEVHAVHSLPLGHGILDIRSRWQWGKKLRSENYSQCIVLPNTLKSALIPWFARIPHRTGWLGEHRYGLLNDIRHLDSNKYPRLVERYLALATPKTASLSTLSYPQLQVNTDNQQRCLHTLDITLNKPILVICPGAEYGPAKRWPTTYHAQVARHFLEKDWQIWILGSTKEQVLAASIQQQVQNRCIDLTGKTSLLDAIDLLALAQLVITNDSGLMHMACAVNGKVIAIYGSSSPSYTPPLSDNAHILWQKLDCSPCFKRECPLPEPGFMRCLLDISPQKVIDTAEALL